MKRNRKAKELHVHHGMNRKALDTQLIALGGEVLSLRRTGEIVYRHPTLARRPRANARRKDAPLHLTMFVIEVIRIVNAQAANDDDFDGSLLQRNGILEE
jgi:hypothetical protein